MNETLMYDWQHRGGPFKPKKITVDETKDYFLCGCKYTHNPEGSACMIPSHDPFV